MIATQRLVMLTRIGVRASLFGVFVESRGPSLVKAGSLLNNTALGMRATMKRCSCTLASPISSRSGGQLSTKTLLASLPLYYNASRENETRLLFTNSRHYATNQEQETPQHQRETPTTPRSKSKEEELQEAEAAIVVTKLNTSFLKFFSLNLMYNKQERESRYNTKLDISDSNWSVSLHRLPDSSTPLRASPISLSYSWSERCGKR